MSVLKSKRKVSQFEVFHHLYKTRKEITDLLLRDFGYDFGRAEKRLTAMRRKMKKLAPILTEKQFTDWFKSWFDNHYRIMSKQQRKNMNTLFNQLKEVAKCSTQSNSQMDEN